MRRSVHTKLRQLRYIAVDGPIGSGKTTLCKMLAEDMGAHLVLEPVESNPFLSDFYADPQRNAFKTQLFFLLNRYQQQVELKQHDLFYPLVICDYTLSKDVLFAQMNLSPDEFSLYERVFTLLSADLPRPDLVVYLSAEPEALLARIKKRNAPYEKNISLNYLERLTDTYNHFFLNYHDTPLLVVDSTSVNYQKHPDDFANLKREIINHRGGTSHLIAR